MRNIIYNKTSFYKNNLIKKFSKIFRTRGLDVRIFNNKVEGHFWKSKLRRLDHFEHIFPEYISVNFETNQKNQISGINFKITGDNYRIALTEIKLLYNKVVGIISPYNKTIEIFGTGFKFNVKDNFPFRKSVLEIHAGYNESKKLSVPTNVYFTKTENNSIILYSNNKNHITAFSSLIKKIKPLNKYKLRGIKLKEEKFMAKLYKKGK